MKEVPIIFRTRSAAFFAVFIIVLLCLTFQLRAQTDDILRIDTDLAAFEVTVSDKEGKPVKNLDAKDFRVFEDGVQRPVDFFQPIRKQDNSRPLSVVFALDVSGSMTPQ